MRLSHTSSVIGVLALALGIASLGFTKAAAAPPAAGAAQAEGNKLMRQSGRQCTNAVRIMEAALPIYHGHRVKAIEIVKIAIDEIRLGLQNDTHDTSGSIKQRLGGIQNLTEPGGNYKQGMINQSNKRMLRAQTVLTKAQANLAAAPRDYGGHRARALQLVDLALGQIQQALGGS